jgi:hypothetical protein
MKKIAILGLLVLIMPFLGFPVDWENIIYTILGSLILVLTVYSSVRKSLFVNKPEEKSSNNTYMENGDCSTDEE